MRETTVPESSVRSLLGLRSETIRIGGSEGGRPRRCGDGGYQRKGERKSDDDDDNASRCQCLSFLSSSLTPLGSPRLFSFRATRRARTEEIAAGKEQLQQQKEEKTLTSATRRRTRGQSCRAPLRWGRASWPRGEAHAQPGLLDDEARIDADGGEARQRDEAAAKQQGSATPGGAEPGRLGFKVSREEGETEKERGKN